MRNPFKRPPTPRKRYGDVPKRQRVAHRSPSRPRWERNLDPQDLRDPSRGYDTGSPNGRFVFERAVDIDLFWRLSRIRQQSRLQYRGNPYQRRSVAQWQSSVVGNGIRPKIDNGDEIIEAWTQWGEQADVTGRLSWNDIEHLAVFALLVDGEFLAVKHSTGDYGFQLQLLDAWQLDIWHNANLDGRDKNGPRVWLGIELDELDRPTGYYIRERGQDPRLTAYSIGPGGKSTRVDASDVVHFFMQEYPTQTRGIPMLASALDRLDSLDDYESSEAIRAALDSRRLGFISRNEYGYGLQEDSADDDGVPELSEEGYVLNELPDGATFQGWDSSHPSSNYGNFVKSQLHAVAASAGIPYHDMASDYSSVNFSAGRLANMTAQDQYRRMQRLLISHLHRPVWESWAMAAELRDMAPPNASTVRTMWVPRRWQHVQPREEAAANRINVEMGLQSRSAIIRERGDDPQAVFDELEQEAAMFGERDAETD